MDLLSLALSLALQMDGPKFTGDFTFDVSPTFGLSTDLLPNGVDAVTLPGLILHNDDPWLPDRRRMMSNPQMLRHELEHVDQQSALGPAFWLAYAATGGRAFEPYDLFNMGAPSSMVDTHDFHDAWTAPPDMVGNYPMFRFSRSGDEAKYQFMPGYPGVNFETQIR